MALAPTLPTFVTFGEILHYLRRQVRLSQRELAIAVGYSKSMTSRLEHCDRAPDIATIHAIFLAALHLRNQPEVVAQLIELANKTRSREAEVDPKLPVSCPTWPS